MYVAPTTICRTVQMLSLLLHNCFRFFVVYVLRFITSDLALLCMVKLIPIAQPFSRRPLSLLGIGFELMFHHSISSVD